MHQGVYRIPPPSPQFHNFALSKLRHTEHYPCVYVNTELESHASVSFRVMTNDLHEGLHGTQPLLPDARQLVSVPLPLILAFTD